MTAGSRDFPLWSTPFCNSQSFFLLEEVENKSVQFWKRQTCKSNPISSNMNDDGFTDLIGPTHEIEASVRAFKTKECDLRPNRTIQSRIHLLVQEMPCLIHETCLCMTVDVLLLVG